jgi:hypothetical protein
VASPTQPDESMDEIVARVIYKHGYGKTRAYTRDDLPSALAVKTYYLQLKALTETVEFDEIGLSVFSQNNEDGILLYILSMIGMPAKRSIEIGCDLSNSTVGIPEGNTINLITNFNFDGLIIDMDPDKVSAIRHFFAQGLTTRHFHAPAQKGVPAHFYSPAIVNSEISSNNINAVLEGAGFTGEIDVASIDIDGADVLVWKHLTAVNPRVVVIEINSRMPFGEAIYGQATTSTASFDSMEYQESVGSSLAAACQVGDAKGYVFVGMNSTLINAFFVRRDLWRTQLPERHAHEYYDHRMNPFRQR